MKCQILFSGKNKKNFINLPSAKNAQRVVKVNVLLIQLTLKQSTRSLSVLILRVYTLQNVSFH